MIRKPKTNEITKRNEGNNGRDVYQSPLLASSVISAFIGSILMCCYSLSAFLPFISLEFFSFHWILSVFKRRQYIRKSPCLVRFALFRKSKWSYDFGNGNTNSMFLKKGQKEKKKLKKSTRDHSRLASRASTPRPPGAESGRSLCASEAVA